MDACEARRCQGSAEGHAHSGQEARTWLTAGEPGRCQPASCSERAALSLLRKCRPPCQERETRGFTSIRCSGGPLAGCFPLLPGISRYGSVNEQAVSQIRVEGRVVVMVI